MKRALLSVTLLALMTVAATILAAQTTPRHGRLFPPEDLGVLEGPDRDAWQMPDAVMDALGIADGSVVADLGAGGGWFTVRLARRVGPNGIVYAQDVQGPMIEAIRRRVDRERLSNVRAVRGAEDDPRLPPGRIDVVLIVDAYHEFGNAPAVLEGLAAALRPGGRLGVVGFTSRGGGPGPVADQRVSEERVIREAEAAGFRLMRRETFLPFQYFLIFGKPAPPVSTTAAVKPRQAP